LIGSYHVQSRTSMNFSLVAGAAAGIDACLTTPRPARCRVLANPFCSREQDAALVRARAVVEPSSPSSGSAPRECMRRWTRTRSRLIATRSCAARSPLEDKAIRA
jgi:hypothetical protein